MGVPESPFPLRAEREIMDKMRVLAKENKRSLNKQIEFALSKYLDVYEKENGPIAVDKE